MERFATFSQSNHDVKKTELFRMESKWITWNNRMGVLRLLKNTDSNTARMGLQIKLVAKHDAGWFKFDSNREKTAVDAGVRNCLGDGNIRTPKNQIMCRFSSQKNLNFFGSCCFFLVFCFCKIWILRDVWLEGTAWRKDAAWPMGWVRSTWGGNGPNNRCQLRGGMTKTGREKKDGGRGLS